MEKLIDICYESEVLENEDGSFDATVVITVDGESIKIRPRLNCETFREAVDSLKAKINMMHNLLTE